SRRALGGLARRTVSAATKGLERLEKTVDDDKESPASRDRAAHRLLVHAFKWGEVLDPGLESREASGSYSKTELNNFYNKIKHLENSAGWERTERERVCKLLYEIEEFVKRSGLNLSENHQSRLDMFRETFKDDAEDADEDNDEDDDDSGD